MPWVVGVSGDEDGEGDPWVVGVSGDEEGVLIKKQAVYRYQAAKNYVGSDEVEIETSRSSDGVSPSTEIEIK